MPKTMKAAVLHGYGDRLLISRVPVPKLLAGHALVRVLASGVNPLDAKIRAGKAPHARTELPAILGIDLAGTVEAVADDVAGFVAGDRVYGAAGGVGGIAGSLAEFVVADARLLAHQPQQWTAHQAASIPLAAITAWEGLIDRADVQPGQHVLIHGGAGGVGHLAVQLAVARGATVYATGSGPGLASIENDGATAIDYTSSAADSYVAELTGGEGFDVIFDTVGGPTLDASFASARRYTGHVVSILGWGTHNLAPLSFRGATYSGVFALLPLLTHVGREHHGRILRQFTALADAGAITPKLDARSFTLDSADNAHHIAEQGASDGKLIITL